MEDWRKFLKCDTLSYVLYLYVHCLVNYKTYVHQFYLGLKECFTYVQLSNLEFGLTMVFHMLDERTLFCTVALVALEWNYSS